MIINNNRIFFPDPITKGWTKKDWALNLIPLGGIASVAYEIGSACLSSRDRTAKISKDFFKSPIQTTLKKIAQCLWVPIVVCGALKLISLIISACWNRCFPLIKSKDSCAIVPPEIFVNHIFPYFNLHELGVNRSVNKRWSEFAIPPILWQSAIYREIAFSSKNWAEWNTDLVKGIDIRQEMLSLPKNIASKLRRSAFRGKSIRETHVLVRMLKGLTVKKLGNLAKKYFPSNSDGYKDIFQRVDDYLGNNPAEESAWLLMAKDLPPGDIFKSYTGDDVPTALQVITCIFAEYSRSGNRLFRNDPLTYTRCREKLVGLPIIVGNFTSDGLCVDIVMSEYNGYGVATLVEL